MPRPIPPAVARSTPLDDRRHANGLRPSGAEAVRSRAARGGRQLATGLVAGMTAAAASQWLRQREGGAALAAPVGHALMATSATVASFSHASALRRHGGDPYSYGAWRAAGIGGAVALPLGDLFATALGREAALDAGLSRSWPGAALAVSHVALGGHLQALLDQRAASPRAAQDLQQRRALVGGAFVASCACHAALLVGYAWRASHADAAPMSAALLADGVHPAVPGGMLICCLGAASGWVARTHAGHEPARVGGFALAVAGLLMALWGATGCS